MQYLTAVPSTIRVGHYSQYKWVKEESQVENLDVTWNVNKKRPTNPFFFFEGDLKHRYFLFFSGLVLIPASEQPGDSSNA